MKRILGGIAVGLLLVANGCLQTEDDSTTPGALPSHAAFPLVLDAIEKRCATLDCHGQPARNLRLYCSSGLRLDPADSPGSGSTTDAEYEADFQAVVGLEPEIMSIVVGERGEMPERLTFVRKGRGREKHKGGTILVPGDSADFCITSWLASRIDEDACTRAAEVIPPW